MSAPKLFISYSWTNPTHEQWVIEFATGLRESGVDVILDKWDLKEGHDAVQFMEQMVANPEIKKVAIICDEGYVAKAVGRQGGVGTETQIISAEVYQQQKQDKFVAIVRERDAQGKAFLPTYYKSRIYIDLSNDDEYSVNFEKLLRWIYDKPLNVKPPIGQMPEFLSDGDHISLGTSQLFKRCVDAIKNHKPHAEGALNEYCQTFAQNMERFRIDTWAGELDDDVVGRINESLPSRNEAIQLFAAVAQYSPTAESMQAIHRLFELLLPYMWNNQGTGDRDNFKFMVHELFLYAVAVFLKYDRIELISNFLSSQFYVPGDDRHDGGMSTFTSFRTHVASLTRRNERLQLRRLSLRADMLKDRCVGTGVEFRHLLQADFVLFIRAELIGAKWWPETLLWMNWNRNGNTCEVFARSSSEAYFKRARALICINTPNDLRPLLKAFADGSRRLPSWEGESFDPAKLLGADRLASLP